MTGGHQHALRNDGAFEYVGELRLLVMVQGADEPGANWKVAIILPLAAQSALIATPSPRGFHAMAPESAKDQPSGIVLMVRTLPETLTGAPGDPGSALLERFGGARDWIDRRRANDHHVAAHFHK